MFKRRVEDFVCENCGADVLGTGYTNHCPCCLWSKHVDVQPGDRSAACGGLMKPIGVEGTVAEYRITHRCRVCAHEAKNKTAKEDNVDALVEIAKRK